MVSLDNQLLLKEIENQKYRLKTFCSGWLASEALIGGMIDLIPARFDHIPALFRSNQIPIDIAFVQITPPDKSGYCSLGLSIDAAHAAMEKADLVVGEINDQLPYTYGDTFVSISDFDRLVYATEPLYSFRRFKKTGVFNRIGSNISSVIENGSCLSFAFGPLFESVGSQLSEKHHLGAHTHFVTDALMDLVNQGVITNRNKETYRGKTLTSYAVGSPKLIKWLDRNPLIEFQSIDISYNPIDIGRNPRFVAISLAWKVDLTGCIALPSGRFNIVGDPRHVMNYVAGAEISKGGFSIFALPSRNNKHEPNIELSIETYPAQFTARESVDMIITEFGIAHLRGRTLRERAQALIEVAHPDDRPNLIEQAKLSRIIYADQIFIPESVHCYPTELTTKQAFKKIPEITFRAIKPSDEEEMRRLFYRFSDEAVYYRYFNSIKSMPHSKMQQYVNIDYHDTMSIVGVIEREGKGKIIAEARYVKGQAIPYPEIAFIVDEDYQNKGIASYLLNKLAEMAKADGISGFSASVLSSNKAMMTVFEKGAFLVNITLEQGSYELSILFQSEDRI